MNKHRVERPDGRYVYFYSYVPAATVSEESRGLRREKAQIELRWNALLGEQVIVSTARQERTFLPAAEACPLCPARGQPTEHRQQRGGEEPRAENQEPGDGEAAEIPAEDFEIAVFENRFPSFRMDAPEVTDDGDLQPRARAAGLCEVVVYTPEHDATLVSLSDARARLLVDVWADRYRELSRIDEVAYVFIFENRGNEIGVTLTHPHGQIYAFPFVPPRVEREHAAAKRHRERTGRCLMCDLVAAEVRDGRRVVAESEGFVAYVPFAARLPYEVHVVAREHRPSLLELSDGERAGLATILQEVQRTYDALWDFPMPYTMSMHQRATDGVVRPGDHLHVEFAPPYRSRDKLKYLAGVETGAGTFINDTSPEEKAAELRAAAARSRTGG